MARFAAFWEEFWKSFTWIGVVVDGHEKVKKVAEILLPILLFSFGIAASVSEIGSALKPFSPYLIGSAAVYVTWKAAIAWDGSKGPIIWIDNSIHGHERQKNLINFEIRVRNIGNDVVDAFIYIVEACDDTGKRIANTGTEKLADWNDVADFFSPGFPTRLFGEKQGLAILFGLFTPEANRPYYLLSLPGSVGVQLQEKQETILIIRVDFHDPIEQDEAPKPEGDIIPARIVKKGKFIKSRSKTFSIIHDTSLPEGLQITQK